MKNSAENEEFSIDVDTGEEVELEEDEATNSALTGKLKKLREELKAVKTERDENLAGWQRAKADLVNFRRTVEEDKPRNEARAKSSLVKNILPALDTFENAVQDTSWKHIDKNWREGVLRIKDQIEQALRTEGFSSFGEKGEQFDPNIHECMSTVPTDDAKNDHTITEVLQKGYVINGELVRPAKVIIAQKQ